MVNSQDLPLRPLSLLKRSAQALLSPFGYVISRIEMATPFPRDFEEQHRQIVERVSPFTLTSPERIFALIEAVKHVERWHIPGGIVECGVWKGGSMMAVALTLMELGSQSRDLYLFDTFSGMPSPGTFDVEWSGKDASKVLMEHPATAGIAEISEVRSAMDNTKYAPSLVHLIPGRVEDTIPANAPDQIALLRLDTDWYESTKHELECLYPRLVSGGILIIDDYGHWRGSRRATDEYFSMSPSPLFLGRIDYTGRIAVKP